jgi:hypothetical protein
MDLELSLATDRDRLIQGVGGLSSYQVLFQADLMIPHARTHNTNTDLNTCIASTAPSAMSTQRAIIGGLSLLLTFTQQSVFAKPATLLPRQLLGNPHDPGEPRPFDPRPGSPTLVDLPRSLSACQNLTVESAVLHASCMCGSDGTATSPSVDLNGCIVNQSGDMMYGAG